MNWLLMMRMPLLTNEPELLLNDNNEAASMVANPLRRRDDLCENEQAKVVPLP